MFRSKAFYSVPAGSVTAIFLQIEVKSRVLQEEVLG
jgi:hypothetical protein